MPSKMLQAKIQPAPIKSAAALAFDV